MLDMVEKILLYGESFYIVYNESGHGKKIKNKNTFFHGVLKNYQSL